MATTLTQAPSEPTHGDVLIAVETLRKAGATVHAKGDTLRIMLPLDRLPQQT